MQAITTPEGRAAFVVEQWQLNIVQTMDNGQTLHHLRVSDVTSPIDLVIANIDPITAATIRKALDGGMVVLG